MERENFWNSEQVFEARTRANTRDQFRRSSILKNSPLQDNFTERQYRVKQKNMKKAENMQTPFYISFHWVYYKLHINFLGIQFISHSTIKPTALYPGLVLGPYFASPCFARARYQAGFNVDW